MNNESAAVGTQAIDFLMPEYKAHKTVRALKIRDVTAHAHPDPNVRLDEFVESPDFNGAHLHFDDGLVQAVGAEWFRKHRPQAGGYYVVYKDDYSSFSPAEAFEEGYTSLEESVAEEVKYVPPKYDNRKTSRR